jgi:hypothetical protein
MSAPQSMASISRRKNWRDWPISRSWAAFLQQFTAKALRLLADNPPLKERP